MIYSNLQISINHDFYYGKKIGADFTMTSKHSERLPLPHTKGTKPAPLLMKSISLLFMSQEKNCSLFK